MKMIKKYAFILLLCIPAGIYAQQLTVRGTVTEEGLPLPGASVVVEGTNRGTTTDFDGNYQIEAAAGEVLVFSYIGLKTQRLTVTGSALDVAMQEEAEVLDEVVVKPIETGYGSIAEKDRASAIAQVGEKDFNRGNPLSPDQLVKGRIAGFQVIDNGGAPGEGSTIRIRGGASISATNNPLIIIDDVPLDVNGVGGTRNFLNALNPNDIETFTILKDASAAAIYGFRASNGVIIITTKKGKIGQRVNVSYNGNVSVSQIADRVEVLTAGEFRSLVNSYGTPQQIALLGNAGTDWQEEIFRDALTHNHNINVTGSLENALNYRVSVGYTDQEGILKRDQLQRSTLSVNLNARPFDHLKIEANTKLSLEDYFYANGGAIGAAITFDPTQPVYQDNAYGNYFQWLSDPDDPNSFPLVLAGRNPVGLLEQQDSEGTIFRTIGNIKFDYQLPFLPGLSAVLNLGYDIAQANTSNRVSNLSVTTARNGAPNLGSFSTFEQKKENLLLDFYLNYKKRAESINTYFDIMVGYAYQKFLDSGYNFSISNAGVENLNPYNNPRLALLGFFGRANITIAGKYILTGSFRRDASSRFVGSDNRWVNSPAGAFAWNVAEEDFLKGSRTLTALKLRFGYGLTAQQEIGNLTPAVSAYLLSDPFARYQIGTDQNGDPVFYTTSRPQPYNPPLKWEETITYNAGMDFGWFGNRIEGSVDAYLRETKDLLFYVSIPSGGGLSNADYLNIGSLENRGLEVTLNTIPVQTAALQWTIGGNFTLQDTEITQIYDTESDEFEGFLTGGFTGGVGNTIQIQSVGYAPNTFFVYEQAYDTQGNPLEGVYIDRNGDGQINVEDRYRYRKPAADIYYGFNTTLQYNNWDFSMFWRGSYGNYNYNNVQSNLGYRTQVLRYNNTLSNASSNVLETNFTDGGIDRYLSDYYIQDASFLKLDNVSLGYTFGNISGGNMKMKVYGTASNVLIISDYDGIDPEVGGGIDNTIYPRPRTYLLGINIDF